MGCASLWKTAWGLIRASSNKAIFGGCGGKPASNQMFNMFELIDSMLTATGIPEVGEYDQKYLARQKRHNIIK